MTTETVKGPTHETTVILGDLLEAVHPSKDGKSTLRLTLAGGSDVEGNYCETFISYLGRVKRCDAVVAVLSHLTSPNGVSRDKQDADHHVPSHSSPFPLVVAPST